MPAAVQFTSSMECTDDNSSAADTKDRMDDIHKMLENDFWADSSDDEGIYCNIDEIYCKYILTNFYLVHN